MLLSSTGPQLEPFPKGQHGEHRFRTRKCISFLTIWRTCYYKYISLWLAVNSCHFQCNGERRGGREKEVSLLQNLQILWKMYRNMYKLFLQTLREAEPACWNQSSRSKVGTKNTIFALCLHPRFTYFAGSQYELKMFYSIIHIPKLTYVRLFVNSFNSSDLSIFFLEVMSLRRMRIRLRSHKGGRGRAERTLSRET